MKRKIKKALEELISNQDLELKTPIDKVADYLVKAIDIDDEEKRFLTLLKILKEIDWVQKTYPSRWDVNKEFRKEIDRLEEEVKQELMKIKLNDNK